MSNPHSKRIDAAYSKFTGEIVDILHDLRTIINNSETGLQET